MFLCGHKIANDICRENTNVGSREENAEFKELRKTKYRRVKVNINIDSVSIFSRLNLFDKLWLSHC